MTDLEELRLEIKLLKERIAALEARPVYLPYLNAPVFPAYPTYPPMQPYVQSALHDVRGP